MSDGFRTRFALSPTGPPHLGMLRTALFAFLAARKEGGSFVVRIDDTDPVRSKREWEEEILAALKKEFGFGTVGASPASHNPARFAHLKREHFARMSPEAIAQAWRSPGHGVRWVTRQPPAVAI